MAIMSLSHNIHQEYVSDSMILAQSWRAARDYRNVVIQVNGQYLQETIRKRGKNKLKEMLGLFFGSTNDDEEEISEEGIMIDPNIDPEEDFDDE